MRGAHGLRDPPGGFVSWLDVDIDDVNIEPTKRPVGNEAHGFTIKSALRKQATAMWRACGGRCASVLTSADNAVADTRPASAHRFGPRSAIGRAGRT